MNKPLIEEYAEVIELLYEVIDSYYGSLRITRVPDEKLDEVMLKVSIYLKQHDLPLDNTKGASQQ